MSVNKAITIGLAGNEISKKITGTDEVSVGRSAIATGAGAVLGTVAAGGLVLTGIASAPVTVPLAIATGVVSFFASIWD